MIRTQKGKYGKYPNSVEMATIGKCLTGQEHKYDAVKNKHVPNILYAVYILNNGTLTSI